MARSHNDPTNGVDTTAARQPTTTDHPEIFTTLRAARSELQFAVTALDALKRDMSPGDFAFSADDVIKLIGRIDPGSGVLSVNAATIRMLRVASINFRVMVVNDRLDGEWRRDVDGLENALKIAEREIEEGT